MYPIRSTLLFLGLVAALTLVLSLAYFGGVAHAQGADPITIAQAGTDAAWTSIETYGPLWGGALLLFGVVGSFLRRNESTHWVAQGKTLAIITTGSMLLAAVLTWKFRGGDTAGLLMSGFLAIKMLVSPTVQPATGRVPQTGMARLGVLLALAASLLFWAPLLVSGCAATQAKLDAIEAGVVKCAKADLPAVKSVGLQLATEALASVFGGGAVPWASLEAEAEAAAKIQGVAVGSCAFGDLIADLARLLPAPSARVAAGVAAAPVLLDPLAGGRSALAALKSKLGVTAIDTGAGVL
jgi:hypothetical protein